MNQVDLAVALGPGYTQSMISMVETGRRGLQLKGLVAAAKELNVSLDYLAGLTRNPKPAPEQERPEFVGEYHPVPFFDPALENDFGGLRVPIWDVDAAAGGGAMVEGAHRAGYLAFERQWLENHRLNARQCVAIRVRGESMEPTLADGCFILVDRARRRRRAGGIFVIATEDGLVVKRLRRAERHWYLDSDHPKWPPVTWPRRAEIAGEVVWECRMLV